MAIKHLFVSLIPDGADASMVRPSDWNADHVLQNESPNFVLAGPISGSVSGSPTFRVLVSKDVGTGTTSGSKFLRDDMSWATVSGSATGTTDILMVQVFS